MSSPREGSTDLRSPGFVFEQRLPARPLAVAVARASAAAACRAWRLGPLCEAVVLAVSELVTNVVRSGAHHVTLRLLLGQRCVRLEVMDDQPGTPQVRHPPADAEGGRGLWLVTSVATRFGVETTAAGKTVWAEFAR